MPVCSQIYNKCLNSHFTVLLLIRLRKHRKNISNTLSSTGSGMGTRKYIKLVFIALGLFFIYLPVQIVFFFRSLPTTLVSYSWSRVHNPTTWSPIGFLHTSDLPAFQYNGPRVRTSSIPGSRGSWSSHLDIVGKAMKWFDSDARKNSEATTITCLGGIGPDS
jgi:hypothetical protein